MSTNKPNLTPAQLLASLVALVPIVANLLRAFGVFDMTEEQEDALTEAMQWAALFAGALVFGDAGLRAARNQAQAKVDAAALAPVEPALAIHSAATSFSDPDAEIVAVADLPTDEVEFASPPPDQSNMPVQPSQDLGLR